MSRRFPFLPEGEAEFPSFFHALFSNETRVSNLPSTSYRERGGGEGEPPNASRLCAVGRVGWREAPRRWENFPHPSSLLPHPSGATASRYSGGRPRVPVTFFLAKGILPLSGREAMEYQLSVDRYDLLEGLEKFKTRRRKFRSTEKALFGFDGRFFSIEALDVVVVAKADGVWPGIASAGASFVVALAQVPPVGDPVDPVRIACKDQHLRFGSLTIGCEWQPVSHTLLKLPAAPDWIEALSLKYCGTRAHILAGGYNFDIEKAERKLGKLVARVTKLLAPLGVTEQDLRLVVEDRLAKRFARSR